VTIGAGALSSQAFVPNKVSDLKLWVDSSDVVFTISSGGFVSQWIDKSLEGNDLSQGTGSRQPSVEPSGTLLFDGSNDFLKTIPFTLNQPTTIYIVCRLVTFLSFRAFYDGDLAGGGLLRQETISPELGLFAGSNLRPLNTLPVGVFGVISVVFNGGSSILQLNNDSPLAGNAGANNMGAFTLGGNGTGSQNANFEAKEIAIYNTAHDATQRKEVIDYLIGKKGFDPNDFPGLEMEMDTLVPGPDTITAGGFVSQWGDQSGNGNHLIQATGSLQPSVEPDGSFLFDGVDDFMRATPFALVQPTTVYILLRQITYGGFDVFMDGDLPGSGFIGQANSIPNIVLFAGLNLFPITTLSLGVYKVITGVFNGGSSVFQANNETPLLGGAGSNNMNGFTLGKEGSPAPVVSNIQVKAILVYNTAHSAAQRKTVVDYLNNRYP
jgi:hypothetical protein